MPDRPNILLIITEQHRGDCLSCEGHPVLMTPNLDAIAGAGVRFTRAYTLSPSCIAARRTLLSGQEPATHGLVGYRNAEWNITETLPAVLSAAGYQTCWIGRSMHQVPLRKRFGFQHMILSGGPHSGGGNQPTEYDDFLARNQPEGGGGYFGGGVMHNDWTARPFHLDEHLHHTSWVVGEALRYLERRDPTCPFFLVVSFLAAHPPLSPPAFYLERYLRTGVPDPVIGDWARPPEGGGIGSDVSANDVDLTGEALLCARAGYYGLINHVDDQLRRLLNPVRSPVGKNTVVLYTSDHGEMLGDHHLWRKTVPYEPSARIPMLLRAPAEFGLTPGTVTDAAVGLHDVMPTLLEFGGVPVPETVDGRSLLPLMRDDADLDRAYLHIEHAPMHHTLTDGREKFIWYVQDGREQFFDLREDPQELTNRIDDQASQERITMWRGRLIAELKDRPEGFSDGTRLIAGRPYPALVAGSG